MRRHMNFGVMAVYCCLLFGCKKVQEPAIVESKTEADDIGNGNVYISGTTVKNDLTIACYWRNDTIQLLENSTSSASDIFVDKGVVLVSGQYEGKPCYWRNGERTMVSINQEGNLAAIKLVGNELYAVGYIHVGPVRRRGFLLKR